MTIDITFPDDEAARRLGYLAKYASDVRIEQRKNQLARIDPQLSELYVRLFGLVRTGLLPFAAFRESSRSVRSDFADRPPSEDEAAEFRLRILHVLMPLNRRLVELASTRPTCSRTTTCRRSYCRRQRTSPPTKPCCSTAGTRVLRCRL